MAYDSLKSTVRQYIKTNDANEITGQILQNVLIAIIDELGDEYVFAGVATPSTDPGVPSRKVAYCASQAGTYTHFDGIVLPLGIHILNWNGTAWSSQTFFTVENAPTSGSNNLITSGAVYQAVNSLLADGFLYAGIASANASSILSPANGTFFVGSAGTYTGYAGSAIEVALGQIIIVKRSSNAWSYELITIFQVDDAPTSGSAKLVKSGGTFNAIQNSPQLGYYHCNTAAATAAKTVASDNYILPTVGGGCIKIKMTNANTAASGVTLQIGSAAAKPLYYAGAAVSASNTWQDGETVEVYYDGTSYYANNVERDGNIDEVYDFIDSINAILINANSNIHYVKGNINNQGNLELSQNILGYDPLIVEDCIKISIKTPESYGIALYFYSNHYATNNSFVEKSIIPQNTEITITPPSGAKYCLFTFYNEPSILPSDWFIKLLYADKTNNITLDNVIYKINQIECGNEMEWSGSNIEVNNYFPNKVSGADFMGYSYAPDSCTTISRFHIKGGKILVKAGTALNVYLRLYNPDADGELPVKIVDVLRGTTNLVDTSEFESCVLEITLYKTEHTEVTPQMVAADDWNVRYFSIGVEYTKIVDFGGLSLVNKNVHGLTLKWVDDTTSGYNGYLIPLDKEYNNIIVTSSKNSQVIFIEEDGNIGDYALFAGNVHGIINSGRYETRVPASTKYLFVLTGSGFVIPDIILRKVNYIDIPNCIFSTHFADNCLQNDRFFEIQKVNTNLCGNISKVVTNKSVKFNGNSYIDFGKMLPDNTGDNFEYSIEAVVKFNSLTECTILSKTASDGTLSGIRIGLTVVNNEYRFYCTLKGSSDNKIATVYSQDAVRINKVYHLFFTISPNWYQGMGGYDNNFSTPSIKMYINGAEQMISADYTNGAYKQITGISKNNTMKIGEQMDGVVELVNIYNTIMGNMFISERANMFLENSIPFEPNFDAISKSNVIIDFDIDYDSDDFGDALTALVLNQNKEINLLGYIVSTCTNYSAAAAQAVCNWFGEPNIPIGAYQGSHGLTMPNTCAKKVAENFNPNVTRSDFPSDLATYRQLLYNAEDKSVVIIATGFLTSLSRLMKSDANGLLPSDDYEYLNTDVADNLGITGKELIKRKVTAVLIVGDIFPDGRNRSMEWNVSGNKDAWWYIHKNLEVPIIYSGAEVGWFVWGLPRPVSPSDSDTNPVVYAYNNSFSPIDKHGMWGMMLEILVARGFTDKYCLSIPCFREQDETDTTQEMLRYTKSQRYFLRFANGWNDCKRLTKEIEDIISYRPV